MRSWAVIATLVLSLAACSGDSPTEVVFQVIEDTEFAAVLGIDLAEFTELPEGVWIRDVTVGTGGDVIAPDDEATINHTGWLSNGNAFSTGEFSFVHYGQPGVDVTVIDGFDIGMEGMAVGDTRILIIPPELAYGAQGAANPQTGAVVIPGGAIVIFEVELVALTN